MNTIIVSLIVMAAIGVTAALLLWLTAKRFEVEEDPRIAQVEALLPGANCGGCGLTGCHAFAEACVRADSLTGLRCPGAGNEGMSRIADLLGLTSEASSPMVAVLRCGGTSSLRPRTVRYDGVLTCRIAAMVGSSGSACPMGCLGCGDCERACGWDAIHINPETGLPEVNDEHCTGCGVCIRECPRHVLELRPKGPKSRRVWVACNNTEPGATARLACSAACIGCRKCERECPFGAITVEDNLSKIDPLKCRLCRKCIAVCPTGAILATWTPAQPVKSPES